MFDQQQAIISATLMKAAGGGGGGAASSWTWVNSILDTMAADEFRKVSGNTIASVALARTRANFDAGSTFADDAAVLSAVKAASGLLAYSSAGINGTDGSLMFHGGGHNDSYDGTIFAFDTSTLLWSIDVLPGLLEPVASGAPSIVANVISATQANPVVIGTDAPHGFLPGDAVTFAGVGGMTDLNGNTYQVGSVPGDTSFSLMAVGRGSTTNGSGFGAFTSGGTATVVWNTATPDVRHSLANNDGVLMPPAIHSYHANVWLGGSLFLLGGNSVAANSGGSPYNRLWFYDPSQTPPVFRGWNDSRTGNNQYITNYGGGGRVNGPVAWNPNDGCLYTGENTATVYSRKVRRWAADFLSQATAATSGGLAFAEAFSAVVFPDPADPSNFNFFVHSSDATPDFTICADIEAGGSGVISQNSYSGAFFTSEMGDSDANGSAASRRVYFWDDLNETIVYWGGESKIAEIVPASSLSGYTTAEVTASASGDIPAKPTSYCSGAKIPDVDAYLLTADSDVWLYKRS